MSDNNNNNILQQPPPMRSPGQPVLSNPSSGREFSFLGSGNNSNNTSPGSILLLSPQQSEIADYHQSASATANNNDHNTTVNHNASTVTTPPPQQQHQHLYRTTPMRYVVLAEYCLLAFMNGVQWIIFANIVDEATAFYGITKYQLDWLTSCFYIAFIISAFIAVAFFDKFGVRPTLVVASLAAFIGGIMKLISVWWRNYPFLLISQFIVGAGQSFFLPVPSALSCAWFGEDERTTATMIASIANPLGGALCIFGQTLFVNAEHSGTEAFRNLFLVVTALNTLDLFLLTCLIPNRPKHAPTEAGHIRHVLMERHAHIPLSARLRRIVNDSLPHIKNWGTLALLLGSGIAAGCFWTLTTLISQIAQPFGLSQRLVGFMGLFNVVWGIPVGVLVTARIDKIRVYKTPLLIVMGIIVLISATFTVLLKVAPDSAQYHFAALFIVAGGAQNLVLPVGFEAAAETTFPLNENVCAALVIMGAEIATLSLMNALPPLLETKSMTPQDSSLVVCGLLVVMNIIGFILVACGKVENNRKQQSEHNDLGIEDSSSDNDDANDNNNRQNEQHEESASLIRNAAT